MQEFSHTIYAHANAPSIFREVLLALRHKSDALSEHLPAAAREKPAGRQLWRKSGRRGGVRQRLCRRGNKPPLPSIIFSPAKWRSSVKTGSFVVDTGIIASWCSLNHGPASNSWDPPCSFLVILINVDLSYHYPDLTSMLNVELEAAVLDKCCRKMKSA